MHVLAIRSLMKSFRLILLYGAFLALMLSQTGCKDQQVEQALDSDANGFLCLKCSAKFFTERRVFPSHCPQCKQPDVDQVIAFSCPADKHLTLGARARGSRRCEKCGGATSGMAIPKEADLKAWGATLKTAAEVGG